MNKVQILVNGNEVYNNERPEPSTFPVERRLDSTANILEYQAVENPTEGQPYFYIAKNKDENNNDVYNKDTLMKIDKTWIQNSNRDPNGYHETKYYFKQNLNTPIYTVYKLKQNGGRKKNKKTTFKEPTFKTQ